MLLPPGIAAASGSVFVLLAPKFGTEPMKIMKEDVWTKKTLKEIEQLQKAIVAQNTRIDDTLETVKKESALALKKIKDLEDASGGGGVAFVSPELEQAIKVVAVRSKSIDEKVSDTSCPEETTTKKKGR